MRKQLGLLVEDCQACDEEDALGWPEAGLPGIIRSHGAQPAGCPYQYSETAVRRLAETDPAELIRQIECDDLRPFALTFAAEALGEVDKALALPVLLKLLEDDAALVREGAVLGLAKHETPEVLERLRQQLAVETSKGVRAAIEGVLEVWP